ncbi:hypothetical protein LWI28_013011 [Acer negundo]|uniref:Uncharacterized protein n=1 Tax=Acer negundo TaxID=4023 RepID=A0AAD5J0R7_ACENE|nr:hypothetical protein LWI28_013011 [Acer negundo]KAK4848035.1 hypothetical protein QYF36_008439 [Acer negundo]
MADSNNGRIRALNPWVLHLQKLGLELKCPLCLNLFSRPSLLPCDHIFCSACIPRSKQCGSECPVCKSTWTDADLRSLPFIDNIVTIFKGFDAFSGATLLQSSSSGVVGRRLKHEDNSSSGRFEEGNKLVQVLSSNSTGDSQSKKSEVPNCVENLCNGDQNPNFSRSNRQTQAGGIQEGRAVLRDVNRVEQSSPGSPPSFGDIKGSDNESSDQGAEHSPEHFAANRPVKRNFDDRIIQEQNGSSASETEAQLSDSKRQKKLKNGTEEMHVKSASHTRSIILQSESLLACNSEPALKSGLSLAGAVLPTTSDDSRANDSICGFCQSSRISEATGPMWHYANGHQVVGDEAAFSNVIHVHSKCIEWAPQAYYDGETVKNLKSELARGAKLKCSRCELKGAALGCYVKSCRRSYHFPCAAEISKCRWDYENFLVLCPAHSSVKFPNEKHGKDVTKSHTKSIQITPQQSDLWLASPNKAKEWVLCGSALSSEEKFLLVKFGSMIGASVSKFWRPDVTHVIAATDAKGACTRTLKVLMAIVNGSWVLKIDWIKACMEAKCPVDEEPYEVSLDNHGCQDGPKTGRLVALNKAPKLFGGLYIYFNGDFMTGYKEDLQSLVIAAGGTVWKSEEELMAQSCDGQAASNILVVYNLDSPEGCRLGEEVSIIWNRLNEAQDLATRIGSRVIGHTWLLESIAAHKLQPLIS